MPERAAPGEQPGEAPQGGHASEWDRPLTEEDAPWQAVWTLGGRFAHPGRRRPPPGSDRRLPLSRELSRSGLEGIGGRAWHWLATLGALAVLLLALRLLPGGAGEEAIPAGWHAFTAEGYAGALPPNWRHIGGESLDYLVVAVPTPAEPPGPGGRRRVTGSPALGHPAVTVGGCRPRAESPGEAQRQWMEELRRSGAALSVARTVEVEGRSYQLLEVVRPSGVTQRALPVAADGCAREFSLTPIEGVVGLDEFSAVLETLRLDDE